jgi:hypothetical protein
VAVVLCAGELAEVPGVAVRGKVDEMGHMAVDNNRAAVEGIAAGFEAVVLGVGRSPHAVRRGEAVQRAGRAAGERSGGISLKEEAMEKSILYAFNSPAVDKMTREVD